VAVLKIGVLVSGRGSNLQALLDAENAPGYPAKIVAVLSNRADAQALERAKRAGVPTAVVPHREYRDRESFDRALDAALRAHGVEFVCLAGFMRLLSPWFVETWRDRMVNIHPSLLPSFKGLEPHAQALAAGVRVSGCTVHFVRAEMDAGPIILQAAVPVVDGDTPDSLAARILAAEHRAYPLALRLIAEGRVRVDGERVIVAGAGAGGVLMSPGGG
jgi:phosphoribosylglycinamide formyltransferase-1